MNPTKLLIATMALAATPLFAGTSGKEVVAPVEQPSLYEWFAGASIGYLTEFDEPMYHAHVGVDTPYSLGGWDLALFLEIGYTEKDESYTGTNSGAPNPEPTSFDLDQLESYLAANATSGEIWGYDLSIMPITFNGKLERDLTDKLYTYVGAGVGFSQVDLDVNMGTSGNLSDDDWVFTAQVFAGIGYDINESWETYGGARWIYFDDADIGSSTLEIDDDILVELGLRYNF